MAMSALSIPVSDMHRDDEPSGIRPSPFTLRPTSRGKIVGRDPRVLSMLDTIDRVAPSSCTVLVTGESGTGKELVVAALHDASSRRHAPLITINCGAIPLELVESELFGHTRGAFTGAQASRRGHVASAEGGTLFLDEVGELPLSVQVKLLRLLQQREYTPVGESRAIKCDVRIVAATHRDLEAEVRAGRFREDLYYRLNVIQIQVPALRERRGDVTMLARHFFRVFAERSGRTDLQGFSPEAMNAIEAYPWPGNVRALENAVERGVLLARGRYVAVEDLFGGARRTVAVEARRSVRPELHPDARVEPVGPSPVERLEIAARLPEPIAPKIVQAPILTTPPERRASNPAFPRVLPDSGVDLFSAVESYQNNLIKQALLRTGGNKNRAAQLLGLNRTTLVEMIRRRGL
jgi:sigma-54 specific flagellar transcriptional regulator A